VSSEGDAAQACGDSAAIAHRARARVCFMGSLWLVLV